MSWSSVRWYAAAQAVPLPAGDVLVAEELLWPDGRVMAIPAAPVIAGTLSSAAHSVVAGPVRLLREGSDSAFQAAVARPAPSDHSTAGFFGSAGSVGVAVMASDTGSRAAVGTAAASSADAMSPRTVLPASPRSFCAGVGRAIDVVEALLEQRHGPGGRRDFVRKQAVHNAHVIAGLAARGAVFVEELDQVPEGAPVVFSARGVSPQVHAEARRFADRGNRIVLKGHAGHVEVEGTYGEARDVTVVEGSQDIAGLDLPDPSKVTYLTQTTLAVDETRETIAALKRRFPQARGPGPEDICYATTNRQDALGTVTAWADLVPVLGSENTSHSVPLVEPARKAGTPAHLIEYPSRIRPARLANVATVGLSAGAFAPPSLVKEMLSALVGLGHIDVKEQIITTENTQFAPPAEVRK